MGDWGEVLEELTESAKQNNGRLQFDLIRRKYLTLLAEHTGRSTILYASKFTQPTQQPIGQFVTISDGDLQGIMTVIHKLPGKKLDLILHSPGGSPQAAEAIVSYLRSRFSHIRVIVPHLAMSAATMIACAADTVVMGEHSFLGPIDPQLVFNAGVVPAEAILDQFDLAKKECVDPKNLGAWMPMLPQYGPALLVQCRHALDLARQLVEGWLRTYMLKSDPQGPANAKAIADWLGQHGHWKSHSRHIPREELRNRGLRIEDLEKDNKAQDLILSVFHATTHTLQASTAVKIIENNLGRAYINHYSTAQAKATAPSQPETPSPASPLTPKKSKKKPGRRTTKKVAPKSAKGQKGRVQKKSKS
ncbi:MAG TPA: ATP-dependent Clp protease proteolytic subunit [Phycisphaerae bacterium]|nr:serine protease [Phycisphaerae bacterium]HOI55672.1 ATP-dependent Clp protease proteolytic subunit [Phycisphaerae bacterium]